MLTRNGEIVSLTPKATEILIMLVEHAGQLVEKDELLARIWADTFVEEANLTQNIFILRRALGDDRTGPKYIETVARRGYRFVGAVFDPTQNGSSVLSASIEPVVAVLPFLNCTGDPELEYLADGLTDNITNNLSRVSKLRVMSRSAVFRYRSKEADPRQSGRELGASVVLVGKINARKSGLTIGVELVDVTTGWQLWGENFDSENKDLLQIQDAITKQLLGALKFKLTGEEERQVTARYTDNAEAYQAYLEGRYHWSRYTKNGIEKAIQHFRRAIELDPNYALAYAAIVDCYLRLATNYLPPEHDIPRSSSVGSFMSELGGRGDESDQRVKLRFEWDWKAAERELRRANDLKTNYPAPHQWYAAYRFSLELFRRCLAKDQFSADVFHAIQLKQLYSGTLSPNEEVQILCTIAREQIEVGNYDAGCLILRKTWTPGEWPKLDGLSSHSAADLLFTTGSLAGCLSSAGRIKKGQKHAEALLSGSIGIFEYLGARRGVAEAKIELALSYYRQGMFELSQEMLTRLIEELKTEDNDLRALAFVRLAVVERHAGHITDSISTLSGASNIVDQCGPLVTGRYHHELAAVLKDAAIDENRLNQLENAQKHFARAYYEFEAIGNLRYTAIAENNHGYLLLDLGNYDEAEVHLLRAQRLFGQLEDKIRRAQVDDCLTHLYTATNRFEMAESTVDSAIASLEADDEEALLAEALTTKGRLFCKLNRYAEARPILEGAWRIAERCGDKEGAGRALLILVEEMHFHLEQTERNRLAVQVRELLKHTQSGSTRTRLEECLIVLHESSQ
ncbi:MAG TPA: winged helix-turn-helix domain-containing protein [Pyrinomonadaceae bacterium]|nr:winged helix-turn-helix domain-containing protein [Pyrinomonadaceae bacterium]